MGDNQFVGKAVYCDARDNTRDYISFWYSKDRTHFIGWALPNDCFKFSPHYQAGTGNVLTLSVHYADGYVVNFVNESELDNEDRNPVDEILSTDLVSINF